MATPTPGPWTIRRDAPDPANPRGVIRNLVCVEGVGPVAEVCAPAGKDWPGRCDANAALIAAAPDLASALEALTRVVENGDDDDWALDDARTALKKAGLDPDALEPEPSSLHRGEAPGVIVETHPLPYPFGPRNPDLPDWHCGSAGCPGNEVAPCPASPAFKRKLGLG